VTEAAREGEGGLSFSTRPGRYRPSRVPAAFVLNSVDPCLVPAVPEYWLRPDLNPKSGITLARGAGLLIFRTRLDPGIWYGSDFNDELVPVSWEHGDRDSHGSAGLVESSSEVLEYGHPAVLRQLEEVRLLRTR
jgi:hypothetical protein